MNEKQMTKYLIISCHCLKNIDGEGTIEYQTEQIRSKTPLIKSQFSEHSPMFRYHDKLWTDRNLTGRMILNLLNKVYYNARTPVVNDEVFFAVHKDGILCCWFDRNARLWVVDDWDDIEHYEITDKQADKIADRMKQFYTEYMDDPRNIRSLQHEYLDFLYC